MTIFGGVGIDRTVEVAALAISALNKYSSPADNQEVMIEVANFLKR